MSISFRAFDTGLRIAPGLASDPVTGKLGEIYWNTTKNNLRICINESPVTWYDLFIQPGTVQDASLVWDSANFTWEENAQLRFNGSVIYSPDNATPVDISLEPGDSTGIGEIGGSIFLKAGSGPAGNGFVFVSAEAITPPEVNTGAGSDLLVKGGDTTDVGQFGGDLLLDGGSGPAGAGDVSGTGSNLIFNASAGINLTSAANAYITSAYIKLASSSSISLNATGTVDPTGLFAGDTYLNTTYNRFRKWDGTQWHWWDANRYNVPTVAIDLFDPVLTIPPATTATPIDGVTVTDGMLVLMPLATLAVQRASVVGINITWSNASMGVDPTGSPAGGDSVYVLSGTSYAGNNYYYNNSMSAWQSLSLPQGINADNILRYNGTTWVVDNLTSVDGLGEIYLRDDTANNANPATSLTLSASNKTAGTGNGGDVIIEAGTSFGGIEGKISFNGLRVDIPVKTSLPLGSESSIVFINGGGNLGHYKNDGLEWSRFDGADINGEITGFFDLSESSVSFDTSTRDFTINVPIACSFYIKGQKTTLTTDNTLTLPSSTGLYYVYFDGSGSLQQASTYIAKILTSDNCLVGIVYYDSVTPAQSTVIDARQLLTIDWTNREYIRQVNALAPSGFDLTLANLNPDGTSNTDYQFTVGAGSLKTADRDYSVAAANVASSQVSTAHNLNTSDYILSAATASPVILALGVPQWNQFSGGWSLQPVTSGYYYNYWVVALRSQANKVVSIAGQAQHSNPITAFAEKWSDVLVPGFDKTELEPLYRITYRYDSAYTNSAASVIVLAESLFEFGAVSGSLNNLSAIVNQNNNTIISGGGTLVYSGTTLSWSAPAYVNLPGVGQSRNTVPAGSGSLSAEGDILYVVVNRSGSAPTNLTVLSGNLSSMLYTGAGADLIKVVAYRLDGKVYFAGRKALTEITLTNNSFGTVAAIQGTAQSVKMDYSIRRGSNFETGTLWVTADAAPAIAGSSAESGDTGVDFTASISGPNLLIQYTTTNTGTNAIMRFSFENWDY